jgi:hypothetical protein
MLNRAIWCSHGRACAFPASSRHEVDRTHWNASAYAFHGRWYGCPKVNHVTIADMSNSPRLR